ncbi:hypothetical protein C8R48DRAFT_615593, partial [Suillus tomentosus]
MGHIEAECWFKDKQCSNCGKAGHTKENCWSKGGGKAGQGPSKFPQKKRGKFDNTRIVTDFEDLNMEDQVNVSNNGDEFEKLSYYDWLADSGTTSHI